MFTFRSARLGAQKGIFGAGRIHIVWRFAGGAEGGSAKSSENFAPDKHYFPADNQFLLKVVHIGEHVPEGGGEARRPRFISHDEGRNPE